MRRFTTSLSSFKEGQAESWSVLPKADPWREPLEYSNCSSVDDIKGCFSGQEAQYDKVSPVTLLRCGLKELDQGQDQGQKPTSEELFRYLEEKIPWLTSIEGLKYEVRIKHEWDLQSPHQHISNVFGRPFVRVPYSRPILP